MINLNKTNNPFTTTVKITPTETAETKSNSPGVYTHFKHTSVTITEMNTTHLKLCVDSNKLTNLDLHLHAWHVSDADLFSKIKWFEGNLESKKYDYLPETAGEYCHAIASMDLLELKAIIN